MTNREKYKQAFSVLHASDPIILEEKTMEKRNLKFHLRPALAAAMAAALLVGGMGAAYAADVGGIQEKLQLWIGGRQVEATVTDPTGDGKGGYTFTYQDDDGTHTVGGGGVAIDADGVEQALPPEEVAQQFSNYVDTGADGRVYLYHGDKSYDITDHLVEGKCKVSLEAEGETVYYDIEDNGGTGWAFSRTRTPQGRESDYIKLG